MFDPLRREAGSASASFSNLFKDECQGGFHPQSKGDCRSEDLSASRFCANRTMRSRLLRKLAFCTLPFAFANPALAQDAAAADEQVSAGEARGVDDIVVTAQRREQLINDIGVSIVAVSGDDLRNGGVFNTDDLSKVVAGLSVSPSNTGITGNPNYTLRGVGFNDRTFSALSAVSIYNDEVPIPYPIESGGLLIDLQRVEVLKGPQGTLYGQNATGGLINYIANKPTDNFEAGLEASYSRFNTFDANGYISGSLSNTLRYRMAARTQQGGDWQKAYTRFDSHGAIDRFAGRFILDWQPDDRLKVELTLNGWTDDSDTPAGQLIRLFPRGNIPFQPGLANYPLPPRNNRAAEWDANEDFSQRIRYWQPGVRLDYDLAEKVTLTSISSYSRFKYFAYRDLDATSLDNQNYRTNAKIRSFSQELRLAGDNVDRLFWLIGANYTHDKVFQANRNILLGTTSAFALPGGRTTGATDETNTRRESYAFFANADFELTPTVTLTGGLRATWVEQDLVGCRRDPGDGLYARSLGFLAGLLKNGVPGAPFPAGTCITLDAQFNPGPVVRTLPEDSVAWRAGVNFKAAEDVLIYGLISRGYKSGNFPNITAVSAAAYTPVSQEKLTAYEIGLKATILDQTLHADLAIYHYDYVDKQLLGFVRDPVFTILERLANIPKSKVDGAEAAITWRPIDGLTARGAVAYTDSKIGEFIAVTSSNQLIDLKGSPFNFAPKWQANADIEYRHPINDRIEAFVGGSMTYQSKTLPTLGADETFLIIPYTLFDARLGIEDKDGRWKVMIWGRNITDKYYYPVTVRIGDTSNRYTGMPRTFGITIGYNWN